MRRVVRLRVSLTTPKVSEVASAILSCFRFAMSCQRHEDKATRVDGDREEARSTPSAEQETGATLVYSVCNWSVTAGFGFENSRGKSRARLTRRLLLFARSDTETGIPRPMAANRPHFPSRSRYVKRIAHPKKRHRQQTKRCTSTARALLRTHQRSESRCTDDRSAWRSS